MKRAAVNLQKFKGVDVELSSKVEHQNLVDKFLKLQKDFVSKKRKFQAAKQKRDTLLGVIKYLRRRRQFLLDRQTIESQRNHHVDDDREITIREGSLLTKNSKLEGFLRHEEDGVTLTQHEQVVMQRD
ncbi:OLC1v1013469C3 [Oldenlandia corymbosa var. corymbosa]|uniref:OLC1v1013469C3 n=1 Tax=Oldenlandia corymbosa var. corymbosa TaxID=529605 RepID=A0AAV1E1Y1_OLDCO|nr:OLC1v1013469C3 [Oldenlandia corymbosa var. corymbosa]